MVWWDFKRWEREIDWMAMRGINFPLAFNGQELIWRKVWREKKLTPHKFNFNIKKN
jgi:alpha-N-acetylglucosaminidase